MPKIDIGASDLKKIDLSKFYGEEAYIHIKKLDRIAKKKIMYYQFAGVDVSMLNEFNRLKTEGKINEDAEYKAYEIVNMMDDEAKEKSIESDARADELYLVNGVDPKKHNFVDEKDEPVEINALFWANIFKSKPEIIVHVINEIKKYNNDVFTLKKKKGKI